LNGPALPSAASAPAASAGAATASTTPSLTHLVLIPSYNTGAQVYATVQAARAQWCPVWVVVDGSTDGTADMLLAMAKTDPGLRVMVLPHNQGKGAAVLHGLTQATSAGFSHVLTMDADGQHPPALIGHFMQISLQRQSVNAADDVMVLGRPVFDASAPLLRVRGRRVSNWWTNLETWGAGVADSLYGFRVYPIQPLMAVMQGQRWMRRFDFDTEAVVRLAWRGVKPINVDAPVKYLSAEEGGVSHFRYGRDNVLLTWMHTRLMLGFVLRLPMLVWRKAKGLPPFQD
jgi:glycosyltransferase involved in cell wall biosynthesis